tara:strand:+ start:38 stop:568 length:531 start_codon:yes stop_codon:yes gene_type:complete
MIIFLILFLLASPVQAEYLRADYGSWIDSDNDCQNTRQEILIRESVIAPTLDNKGCKVISGLWKDKYTNKSFTNPKDLDIDHFVPLAEVERSGGDKWSVEKKHDYANDLKNRETLIAVDKSANRSKGDKDISNWLPANKNYHCNYVARWIIVKQIWNLTIDQKEQLSINKILKKCY